MFIIGCAGSLLVCKAFLWLQPMGLLCLAVHGLLIVEPALLSEYRLYAHGFSSCGFQAQGCGVLVPTEIQSLWPLGLVGPASLVAPWDPLGPGVPSAGPPALAGCSHPLDHIKSSQYFTGAMPVMMMVVLTDTIVINSLALLLPNSVKVFDPNKLVLPRNPSLSE